jgi:hypothetical protein
MEQPHDEVDDPWLSAPSDVDSDPDNAGQGSVAGQVGVVGSPSSTGEITMDVVESASGQALLGDLVYTCHPLIDGRHLLALGAVGEIQTRNRWHEDPNMRGVLRVHGSLPHLSADGDVRTATVRVQAVYDTGAPQPPFAEPPRESGGALGMSPTTGQPVHRVSEDLVQGLVGRHGADIVYLGQVYRSPVRLPMFVREFTSPATDGAFHTGIFGRSGSGKTALATYMLALQLRHPNLSLFVFDPQGQFTHQRDMVLDLQQYARDYGRQVQTLSIAEDIQLRKDARLVFELLDDTRFFPGLTIKSRNDNRESARVELERKLRDLPDWDTRGVDDVMRTILSSLAADQQALARIYNSATPRIRFANAIQTVLDNPAEFGQMLAEFAPIHSLFTRTRARGGSRVSMEGLLRGVVDGQTSPKPYVVIDLSNRSGTPWLDNDQTKARLMRKIASDLRRIAEQRWRGTGDLINCSVVFDEAARFAPASPDGEEVARLSAKLVEYVRETRKTGLGWTFITQEINSLNPAIYNQLTVRAYGYGMTSGSDLNRLRDEMGRGSALDLYQSFPDPKSLSEKVYPFMLTGPVSPLTFTAAPVFLQVFTDETRFREANRHHFPGA